MSVLSDHYLIPTPSINWAPVERATTTIATNTINVGSNAWMGVENTIIHEYAHVLSWCYLNHYKHGPIFWRSLLDITSFLYGDPKLYSWSCEYKAGQNFAKNHGLL